MTQGFFSFLSSILSIQTRESHTAATVRLLLCTLINATLQVSHANNSLLNWYWVRLSEQTQKMMITVYTPSIRK